MINLIRNITKGGVLACLAYVMWYKWVFGEQVFILYAAAVVAIVGMLLGIMFEKASIIRTIPFVCLKDNLMCIYSLLIGAFVATSFSVLVSNFFTYFAFSLACLAACYVSLKDGFDWLLKGFILVAIICAVWTLVKGYEKVGYGIVLSSTNNPHTLGFVMDLGLFAIAYRSKKSVKSFVLNLLFEVLFLYVIIQCGSRKCLIAAAFIVIPWFLIEIASIYKNGTSVQKVVATIIILFVIVGVVYYVKNIYVLSDSFNRMENIEESEANKARIRYFELGFEYFWTSPIFGIGLGQFAVLNPDATYSHSVITEAIASWGIIGALVYFLPIITITYRTFRLAIYKREKSFIMIAGLCAMELFMAFFQIYFYSLPHMIAWVIIALFVEKNNVKILF